MHVDLPALLNHDGASRGKFRPMTQWARNALIENPHGVSEIDVKVVRNLAVFAGCSRRSWPSAWPNLPPPGDLKAEENPA